MYNYIDPTFSLFGIEIAWYAVCIMVGVMLALWAGIKEGKKIGIPSDDIYWGIILVLPCAIIGARLWYILFNLDQNWTFTKIIGLEGGLEGLAIQGGFIAAMITIFFYCKAKKLSLYKILDVVAPGFLIGQACGRWGNFCNHELFGPKVKNIALFKNIFPEFITENMRYSANSRDYYHPAFLYESLLNVLGLILMLVLRRKFKKLRNGDLIGIYLMWYGCVRIFTESLRGQSGANEILMLGPIPVSIMISVIFIVSGIALLVTKSFVGPKTYYQDVLTHYKNNKIDTLLFDLDGTLLDTKALIDRSFVHTFEKFRPGYVLTDEELDSFFGPTLNQTFSRYSNDENEIKEMFAYYRAFNVEHHDSMVKAMSGAKDVLKQLHNKGYNLGVVSSKKTDLVRRGLEVCGLVDYMDVIVGMDDVANHKPAPDGILLAIETLRNQYNENLTKEKTWQEKIKDIIFGKKKEVKNIVYVGDTLNDINAGKAANVKTIGALYIKNPEIMLEAAPDYVINDLYEILRICVE